MARYQKLQNLPKESEVNLVGTVRPMTQKDIPRVYNLLVEYLKKFDIKLKLREIEVAHMLLPREGVIHSFVVENSEMKKITDFFSFYRLPSTILKKVGHNHDHVNVITFI